MDEKIVDGRYELIEVMASGGMATVWRARDTRLGREVALKRPHPTSADDPVWARFEREARLAAGLSHPHVVTVHDSGVDANGPYLVMELLDAPSLAQHRVDRDEAIVVGVAIADALSAIHAVGIVHRDIKPANVILAPGGPKLTDFGIALGPSSTGPLTLPHQVLATPGYAAPEVLAGRPATPAADIFALGALVYELVSGRPAFPGAPGEPRRRPPALGIPDLDALLGRCMAEDPLERPTAADVAAGLRRGGMPTMAMPVPAPTGPPLPSDAPLPSDGPGREAGRPDATIEYRVPPGGTDGAGSTRGHGAPAAAPANREGRAERWALALLVVVATVALTWGAWALVDRGIGPAREAVPVPTSTTLVEASTTTGPETTTTAPETTTTTPETTTTTVPETTTTAPETTTTTAPETTVTGGQGIESARDGFVDVLEQLRDEDRLGRREVREITGDVDQAVEAHRSGDLDEARRELEEIGDQIEATEDGDAAQRLVDEFVELAEAMGFRVEFEA